MKYQNTKFQITNNKFQINNNDQNYKFKTNRSINMKTQITNNKFQINSNDQNCKFKTNNNICSFVISVFVFGIYLFFGIYCL